jgi:hypothetical protein
MYFIFDRELMPKTMLETIISNQWSKVLFSTITRRITHEKFHSGDGLNLCLSSFTRLMSLSKSYSLSVF